MSPTTAMPRDRGAVIPLVALVLPVLIIMTAFAVDLGRQRDSRRTMQATADVLALDMMRVAEGRSSLDVWDDPATDDALAASASRNELTLDGTPTQGYATGPNDLEIQVLWGELGAGGVFTPHHTDPSHPPVDEIASAVEVTVSEVTDYFFQPGSGGATRTAVASHDAKAGFQIGSFAAAARPDLDPLHEANRLINNTIQEVMGPTPSSSPDPEEPETDVQLLGYHGLAVLEVSWEDIAAELGLVTPEEVFSSEITIAEVMAAALDVARRDDPNLVNGIAQIDEIEHQITVPGSELENVYVEDVMTVESGSERAGLESNVNLLDLLGTSVLAASADEHGSGGSGAEIPDLEAGPSWMPLGSGSFHVVQSPVWVIGRDGDEASTNQLDLQLALDGVTFDVANVARSSLNNLSPGLGDAICDLLFGLLGCGTVTVSVDLTASLQGTLAEATGRIDGIGCGDAAGFGVAAELEGVDVDLLIEVTIWAGDVSHTEPVAVPLSSPPGNDWAWFEWDEDEGTLWRTQGAAPLRLPTVDLSRFGPTLEGALDGPVNQDLVPAINNEVLTPIESISGVTLFGADVVPKAHDCHSLMLVG